MFDVFVDALSFGKPGIYLRNPFVEHYFERMGDIGYLCDSLDQVQETVESILLRFPLERYRAQRRAVGKGRRLFAPETLVRKRPDGQAYGWVVDRRRSVAEVRDVTLGDGRADGWERACVVFTACPHRFRGGRRSPRHPVPSRR